MFKALRATALALLATLAFALVPTARADQADYEMPLTGPMSFPTFLSTYLNPVLQAIITNNSGASAPTTTGQPENYQWWVDTSGTPSVLKIYDGSAWLAIANITIASDAITLRPPANDTGALGVSGTAWADLFLASGAVINFNAGNTTLTQSSGNLALAGSATDVYLDISAANAGAIKFPATQNADAGVNVLDDYEETTVSPTITAEVGTPTTTSTSIRETKIGRLVVVQGLINITTVGTASGAVIGSGLTFSSAIISGCNGFSGSLGKGVAGYVNGTGFNLRNSDGTTPWVAGNTVYFQCAYTF